tara:strand:+ start:8230 stop:8685 length:456 start_codon:yes stop_codon:yes gene_type:complete
MILNYTYNQIIGFFETATNEHLGYNAFGSGPLDYLDAQSQNTLYPLLFVRPMSSPGLQDNTKILNFEVYSIDVPALSNQSPVDVMSNMELYLYDIGAWFNRGPLQQNLEYTIQSITPVNEAFKDRVFGWAANVNITVPYVYNFCNFPTGSL